MEDMGEEEFTAAWRQAFKDEEVRITALHNVLEKLQSKMRNIEKMSIFNFAKPKNSQKSHNDFLLKRNAAIISETKEVAVANFIRLGSQINKAFYWSEQLRGRLLVNWCQNPTPAPSLNKLTSNIHPRSGRLRLTQV